jgi:hypothetical protein
MLLREPTPGAFFRVRRRGWPRPRAAAPGRGRCGWCFPACRQDGRRRSAAWRIRSAGGGEDSLPGSMPERNLAQRHAKDALGSSIARCNKGSSPPRASSAWRSSQPPTWVVANEYLREGAPARPLRVIISCFFAGIHPSDDLCGPLRPFCASRPRRDRSTDRTAWCRRSQAAWGLSTPRLHYSSNRYVMSMNGRTTRANVTTSTRSAPAFFSARAQALTVAPVVNTSSTKARRLPAKSGPLARDRPRRRWSMAACARSGPLGCAGAFGAAQQIMAQRFAGQSAGQARRQATPPD